MTSPDITFDLDVKGLPFAVPFELTGTGTAWAQVMEKYRKGGGVGTFPLDEGAYMMTVDYDGPEQCELNVRSVVNGVQSDWNVTTTPAGDDGRSHISPPAYVTVAAGDNIAIRVRTRNTVQTSIDRKRRATVRVYPVDLYTA